jgi:hypothetical protein
MTPSASVSYYDPAIKRGRAVSVPAHLLLLAEVVLGYEAARSVVRDVARQPLPPIPASAPIGQRTGRPRRPRPITRSGRIQAALRAAIDRAALEDAGG